MSQEEKREAGKRLLKMTDWGDREIARKLGVVHTTVGRWRGTSGANAPDTTTRTVTRNGKTYEMDTGNIGKGSDGKTGCKRQTFVLN